MSTGEDYFEVRGLYFVSDLEKFGRNSWVKDGRLHHFRKNDVRHANIDYSPQNLLPFMLAVVLALILSIRILVLMSLLFLVLHVQYIFLLFFLKFFLEFLYNLDLLFISFIKRLLYFTLVANHGKLVYFIK